MRNIFFALVAGMLITVVSPLAASAGDPVYLYDSVAPATGNYTLLSAVTSTGAGTAKCFYKVSSGREAAVSQHGCTSTWSGTAPTNIVHNLECSTDGRNFETCGAVTMTASPTLTYIDKPGLFCIRDNYVSKSGGDGTTALTTTCRSGGIRCILCAK